MKSTTGSNVIDIRRQLITILYIVTTIIVSIQASEQDDTQKPIVSGGGNLDIAVIHIGPHKTGTTTIQTFVKHSMLHLYSDGYEIPGNWNNFGSINMYNLTNCLLKRHTFNFHHTVKSNTHTTNNNNNNRRLKHNRLLIEKRIVTNSTHLEKQQQQQQRKLYDYSCDESILDDIKDIANRGSNILLTAESFSYDTIFMSRVGIVVQPWKRKKIIIYYRRFYEWFKSQWNQNYKELHPNDRPSFVEWTQSNDTIDRNVYNNYIIGLIPRWEEQFGEDSISLYNMHNLPDNNNNNNDIGSGGITGTFFCTAIPNATNTCNNYKNKFSKMGTKSEGHANPSKSLEYEDLAYAAYELQLVSKDKYDFISLTQLVYKYQVQTLQLSIHDFDKQYTICLTDDTLNRLLEITLYTEELYFPEYYNKFGENEIKLNFHKHKNTILCSFNALEFLKNNITWQNFFKQL